MKALVEHISAFMVPFNYYWAVVKFIARILKLSAHAFFILANFIACLLWSFMVVLLQFKQKVASPKNYILGWEDPCINELLIYGMCGYDMECVVQTVFKLPLFPEICDFLIGQMLCIYVQKHFGNFRSNIRISQYHNTRRTFYWNKFILILARIRNYNIRDWITYTFLSYISAICEIWEWIRNFISHLTEFMITCYLI